VSRMTTKGGAEIYCEDSSRRPSVVFGQGWSQKQLLVHQGVLRNRLHRRPEAVWRADADRSRLRSERTDRSRGNGLSGSGWGRHTEYLCRPAQGLTHMHKYQLNADLLESLKDLGA
jgi:hypothetical protein